MVISFSRHALFQLKDRGITKKSVVEVLKHPDNTRQQSVSRFVSVRKIRRKGKPYVLIVVSDRFHGDCEIVTAFLSSKISKYL